MGLAWVVPLGLLVGLVMGSLGGGGAIITIPILVYVFAQPPTSAAVGSLIIVGLGAIVGVITHARAGRVRLAEGLAFGGVGGAGAVVGALLSAGVPDRVLMLSFAVLLCGVAATLVIDRRSLPVTRRRWPVIGAAALGVGLLTGFFGVGGGFAAVPALVLVLGFPMTQAVGTSLVVILINTLVALVTRAFTGFGDLDWRLIGPFAVTAALGTLIGARIAGRLPATQLRLSFAGLLIALAGFLLLENLSLLG